jgi:hypothetical protein
MSDAANMGPEAKAIRNMLTTMMIEAREWAEQIQREGSVHDAEKYRNTAIVFEIAINAIDMGDHKRCLPQNMMVDSSMDEETRHALRAAAIYWHREHDESDRTKDITARLRRWLDGGP